jgi:hypothetical protein
MLTESLIPPKSVVPDAVSEEGIEQLLIPNKATVIFKYAG